MKKITAGYALCGSFCTISKSIEQMRLLRDKGIDLVPIMSPVVYSSNTRFYDCEDLKKDVRQICNTDIIHDIITAEPIGPKNLFDILIVSPCTGNTIGKLANGITDTSVTMAVKANLRNNKPVLLAAATNDALGASAKNIGLLMNTKNIYFVPLGQDDPLNKNNSLVCDFKQTYEAMLAALEGKQLQPIII